MRNLKFCAAVLLALNLAGNAAAQTTMPDEWNGVWIADGSLFKIGVKVTDGNMVVTEVDSLGFAWTASAGIVAGNQATIEVQYAGATGRVAVQLLDGNSGVASLLSCLPEFMVVCALAKDRQARFIRVPETAQ